MRGRCLVTLGAFDGIGDGRVVELCAERGAVREVLRYTPPEALRVPGKGFTGAAWLGGRLVICGAATVHHFEGDRCVETWAMPSFNDLHGLAVDGERVWVVNTGLDAIDVFDATGRFLGSHGFEPAWLAARRIAGEVPARADWPALLDARWQGDVARLTPDAPGGDYYADDGPFHGRKVRDRVHPNHVCIVGGRPWVTSLALSAVVDVSRWQVVARFDSPPHDGIARDGALWVTTVDGRVEARRIEAPDEVVERWDVSAMSGVFGWCRGLCLDDDLLWVGFTAIHRPPRFPWDRAPFAQTRTAVVCLERASKRVRRVFDLEGPTRHAKVGGLVAAR